MSGKTNGGVFNPKNLNLFGYTYNNPVTLFDPDGNAAASPTFRRGPLGFLAGWLKQGHDIFEGAAIDNGWFLNDPFMNSSSDEAANESSPGISAPTKPKVRDKIKEKGLTNTDEGSSKGKTEIYEGPQEAIDEVIEDLTKGLEKENVAEGVDKYSGKDGSKITVREKSSSTETLGKHTTIDTFGSKGNKNGEFKMKQNER